MAYPIASLPDGRVRMSDGSIRAASFSYGGTPTYSTSANVGRTVPTPTPAPSGGGSTGGGNTGGGGGGNIDLAAQAQAEQERIRNAILARLDIMKQEAGRLRGQAKSQFDFTTGEIARNYGQLKELSKQKLQQALDTLAQEDVNVQQLYGRTGGNARRAMESALGRNRMLYRALGALGSSFYTGAQGETTNQAMNTINDVLQEEAGKRAAIGTQKSSTTTDFAKNELAIGAEENSLRNQAMNDYNNAIAQADLLEKNYNVDSTEALQAAEQKLSNSLEMIRQYAIDKSIANKASTAATTGQFANFANTYNAINPIKETLASQPAVTGATNYIASAQNAPLTSTGATTDTSLLNNLRRTAKTSTYDPNQYYINRMA